MRRFKNKKTGATFEIVVPDIIKAIEKDKDYEEINDKFRSNKKASTEKAEKTIDSK